MQPSVPAVLTLARSSRGRGGVVSHGVSARTTADATERPGRSDAGAGGPGRSGPFRISCANPGNGVHGSALRTRRAAAWPPCYADGMGKGKPPEAVWAPVTDLPADAGSWGSSHYRGRVKRWHDARLRLEDPAVDRTLIDIWLLERARAFAIKTGRIEGLYTLRRGVTEQLIAEGFGGVRAAHALEPGLSDRTLKGLLEDQHAAVELVFEAAAGRRPLSHHTMKSWHQLLTRHQEHAAGVRDGRRVLIELRRGDCVTSTSRTWKTPIAETCVPSSGTSPTSLRRLPHPLSAWWGEYWKGGAGGRTATADRRCGNRTVGGGITRPSRGPDRAGEPDESHSPASRTRYPPRSAPVPSPLARRSPAAPAAPRRGQRPLRRFGRRKFRPSRGCPGCPERSRAVRRTRPTPPRWSMSPTRVAPERGRAVRHMKSSA